MVRRSGEKFGVILDASVKIFARRGYHRSRVADIAREAGVADGTVYIYFENKEDILVSVFQHLMYEFVEGLTKELRECQDPEEKIETIIRYHLATLGSNPDQARVTQVELRQIDQTINQGISEPLIKYFQLIEEVIEEGKEKGHYRHDINTRTARKVIFGAIDEVVTCWIMSNNPYNLLDLQQPVFELLVKGLR